MVAKPDLAHGIIVQSRCIFEIDAQQETDGQPRQRILIKGDNNAIDDTGLYRKRKLFVERKEIL